MTKAIAALIIIGVLWGGWELFFYWEKVKNEEEVQKKQALSLTIAPEQLSGLPFQLEASLRTAQGEGLASFKNWMKTYGPHIQDPRKAWIELDYCVAISKEDPAEARRTFADVKKRTPQTSPMWPRIQKLEKTYQ